MDVRSQVAMVIHLDKCIGCHSCSVACKNLWTEREGSEYMWWNNVETKPGTGYPTRWEDQESYRGGWKETDQKLALRSTSKSKIVSNIFHNPAQPSIDDYYEPWTYQYRELFGAPEGDDQPGARPVSLLTGEPLDVAAGPNWDDDLGGSQVYAAHDPNLYALTAEERAQMMTVERLALFYLPRVCNHCLNPSCVASCPSGALYKRGEDGIVLQNQDRCRAWRSCISACPYKKTYYNWSAGKSEKCILCFPQLETGQAPACFHGCVGRSRFLGTLLYDAERIPRAATSASHDLVQAQRDLILDADDPQVVAAAKESGIPQGVLESARRSPVRRFVKEWKLALPLHAEWRTLPMLFYVPPLLPVMSSRRGDVVRNEVEGLFGGLDEARAPLAYLGALFAAGNLGQLRYALEKQLALRLWRRHVTVGDLSKAQAEEALAAADCDPEEAQAIHTLVTTAGYTERFALPPFQREMAIEMLGDPHTHRSDAGFGRRVAPKRS